MIPYGKQEITQADIDAVVDVLKSDFLTTGPKVTEFEARMRDYTGCEFAVAYNSATAALHAACFALGLGKGDRLWTAPNTFVASANCGLYLGATVDFVDIDERTYNMSVRALTTKLEEADRAGRLPKIVIPVHFAGQSCEMAEIKRLSEKYGFKIIEDASHAVGADYESGKVGNCRYSDVTIFSFHPVKIITTGEGGMAMTNDSVLSEKMARFRTHGITRNPKEMVQNFDGPWYYEQHDLGFNYRITDIQCALGLSQLARLDSFVTRRRHLAARYDEALGALPVIRPFQSSSGQSAWHLYVVQVDETRTSKSRREVFDGLRANGIGVNVHYIPVHTQPYYRKLGFESGQFPVSERYYSKTISLPMYSVLTDAEQVRVVEALRKVLDDRK